MRKNIDTLIPYEINNKEKLPSTFNFAKIQDFFVNKWTRAFGRPLPLIETSEHTKFITHHDEFEKLFDFKNAKQSYNFKHLLVTAFECDFCRGNLSEDDKTQNCYTSLIRSPIDWLNAKLKFNLLVNANIAQKNVESSASISSKKASQSMGYTVNNEKTVKISNLRPDLTIKDSYCRIFLKGKCL